MVSRFYWENKNALAALREYAAYYYGPDTVAAVVRAVRIMEKNQQSYWLFDRGKNRFIRTGNGRDFGSHKAYAQLKKTDQKLPSAVRRNWRWRILLLRALLEHELNKNGGFPNRACETAFQELAHVYHARKAERPVAPPSEAVRREMAT